MGPCSSLQVGIVGYPSTTSPQVVLKNEDSSIIASTVAASRRTFARLGLIEDAEQKTPTSTFSRGATGPLQPNLPRHPITEFEQTSRRKRTKWTLENGFSERCLLCSFGAFRHDLDDHQSPCLVAMLQCWDAAKGRQQQRHWRFEH